MTPQTMVSGFKATGVFPLNRRAIHVPGNDALTNTPTAVVARRGGINHSSQSHTSVPKVHPTEEGLSPGSSVISPTANDVSADMNDPIWPDYDEQGTPSMYVYVWAGASCMLGHGGSLEVCVKVKFFVAVFTVRDSITR